MEPSPLETQFLHAPCFQNDIAQRVWVHCVVKFKVPTTFPFFLVHYYTVAINSNTKQIHLSDEQTKLTQNGRYLFLLLPSFTMTEIHDFVAKLECPTFSMTLIVRSQHGQQLALRCLFNSCEKMPFKAPYRNECQPFFRQKDLAINRASAIAHTTHGLQYVNPYYEAFSKTPVYSVRETPHVKRPYIVYASVNNEIQNLCSSMCGQATVTAFFLRAMHLPEPVWRELKEQAAFNQHACGTPQILATTQVWTQDHSRLLFDCNTHKWDASALLLVVPDGVMFVMQTTGILPPKKHENYEHVFNIWLQPLNCSTVFCLQKFMRIRATPDHVRSPGGSHNDIVAVSVTRKIERIYREANVLPPPEETPTLTAARVAEHNSVIEPFRSECSVMYCSKKPQRRLYNYGYSSKYRNDGLLSMYDIWPALWVQEVMHGAGLAFPIKVPLRQPMYSMFPMSAVLRKAMFLLDYQGRYRMPCGMYYVRDEYAYNLNGELAQEVEKEQMEKQKRSMEKKKANRARKRQRIEVPPQEVKEEESPGPPLSLSPLPPLSPLPEDMEETLFDVYQADEETFYTDDIYDMHTYCTMALQDEKLDEGFETDTTFCDNVLI